MSNSAVLRGEVSRCKSATEFPRKCGRCVKIERQNLLGKIVAATEFPVTPEVNWAAKLINAGSQIDAGGHGMYARTCVCA